MRIVMEKLLRNVVLSDKINSYESLFGMLNDIADKRKTSKLWIDCFIKIVLLIMEYIRSEKEGDWPSHLWCLKKMLPYSYAAPHVHYARYVLLHLRDMKSLPSNVLDKFLKREHVMRHIPGLWNGIWSDMFIKSTFMRYGHGKRGIIGITLKPETMKVWALGLHLCSSMDASLSDMTDGNNQRSKTTYKEEGSARMKSDAQDREAGQNFKWLLILLIQLSTMATLLI